MPRERHYDVIIISVQYKGKKVGRSLEDNSRIVALWFPHDRKLFTIARGNGKGLNKWMPRVNNKSQKRAVSTVSRLFQLTIVKKIHLDMYMACLNSGLFPEIGKGQKRFDS
ncbi:unnamed protein product [Ceratitis capitata]|uniref:(Mediterranean fruit fly) hypothetical protein n=1 Tax=Ceratitis capitata TaxID=7213 RepID=A0A811UR69_CERCA|nr:unnamed protein product [Ceratitis capitata]